VEAVRKGRAEEFRGFMKDGAPPDPQNEATFFRSKLSWSRDDTRKNILLEWYRRLIDIRKALGGACVRREDFDVEIDATGTCLRIYRRSFHRRMFAFINFTKNPMVCRVDDTPGKWLKILDSSDQAHGGDGVVAPEGFSAPESITLKGRSVVVYAQSTPETKERQPL